MHLVLLDAGLFAVFGNAVLAKIPSCKMGLGCQGVQEAGVHSLACQACRGELYLE
jgi:hypothetical protein